MLSAQETTKLYDALLYLHMSELRDICTKMQLPSKGKKVELIQTICLYASEGKILALPKIPAVSRALKTASYPLHPATKILYGNYKNDLATRKFIKSLVGEHFHYTAFGIDWINKRWFEGNPPTYGEFAEFWEKEYKKRQIEKAPPKEEWAYINFVQEYGKDYPDATRQEMMAAWEERRKVHRKMALQLLTIKE